MNSDIDATAIERDQDHTRHKQIPINSLTGQKPTQGGSCEHTVTSKQEQRLDTHTHNETENEVDQGEAHLIGCVHIKPMPAPMLKGTMEAGLLAPGVLDTKKKKWGRWLGKPSW